MAIPPDDEPQTRGSGAALAQRARTGQAALKRARILDAAERCFIDAGFHAASMAHIADTAGVSAGLIYRYFDSKSAIVRAIIERHLETEGTRDIDLMNSAADLSREMLEAFERWQRGDDPKMNAALFLELTAASTRDAEIARVVRRKDQIIERAVIQAVRRMAHARGVRLTSAAARGRAIILLCLVEGLAFRAVRDPKLRRSTLQPVLESLVAVLVGGSLNNA